MFQDLQDLLPKAIKSLNLEHKTQAAHAIYLTKQYIDKEISKIQNNYKIVSFHNNILKIYCTHPLVAQELNYHYKELLAYIKAANPDIKIVKLQTTTQKPNSENIN